MGNSGLKSCGLERIGLQDLESSYGRSCNVLISVGTSEIVRPAADIPEIALASGATVIHVNTADFCVGAPNELMLMGLATRVLPALLQQIPFT